MTLPKRVVDFPRERDTFRMEIVNDLDEQKNTTTVNLGNR